MRGGERRGGKGRGGERRGGGGREGGEVPQYLNNKHVMYYVIM